MSPFYHMDNSCQHLALKAPYRLTHCFFLDQQAGDTGQQSKASIFPIISFLVIHLVIPSRLYRTRFYPLHYCPDNSAVSDNCSRTSLPAADWPIDFFRINPH